MLRSFLILPRPSYFEKSAKTDIQHFELSHSRFRSHRSGRQSQKPQIQDKTVPMLMVPRPNYFEKTTKSCILCLGGPSWALESTLLDGTLLEGSLLEGNLLEGNILEGTLQEGTTPRGILQVCTLQGGTLQEPSRIVPSKKPSSRRPSSKGASSKRPSSKRLSYIKPHCKAPIKAQDGAPYIVPYIGPMLPFYVPL